MYAGVVRLGTRPTLLYASVAELEYAQRLGRCPARVAGSNPARGTR